MNPKKPKQKALVVVLWKSEQNSQVLLLKVTPERGGFWQPVTGHVEPGESYLDAALREASEETGFTFTDPPQYLGMEYQFEGRFGPALERAYSLTVAASSTPPTPKLDPKEHTDFQWCTPSEALQAVTFPANREAIYRATHPTPPLHLSSEGVWSQEGEEITHERTKALLYNSVKKNQDGSYCVEVSKDQVPLVLEDTPYFISSYESETGIISLLGGRREPLNPSSLTFQPGGSAYCVLADGNPAKFLRSAYYTLAQNITDEPGSDGKKYFLNFLGRRHELRVPH